MASTLNSLAEVFLIDSRTKYGGFLFPSAANSIGRKITIKDPYGAFRYSTLQLLLNTPDTFEDNAIFRLISTPFASMQFVATPNRWVCYASNTSGGFNSNATGFNCNIPSYPLDINGVANFSTLTSIRVTPSLSNLWVAVGNGTHSILHSGNGIAWSPAENAGGGFSIQGNCVAFNGKMWVAGGQDTTVSNQFKYSYDGKNWTNITSAIFDYPVEGCHQVKWNGRYWVAAGGATTSNGTLKYSYDGIKWTNANSGFSVNTGSGYIAYNVDWNGSMWIASGYSAPFLLYSYDGINWSVPASIPNTNTVVASHGVTWDGSQWIATFQTNTGLTSDILKYSSDGVSWIDGNFSNIQNYPTGVMYSGRGYWVSAWDTPTNNLFYSPNCITNFQSIATGGSGFSESPPVYNGSLFVFPQRTNNGSNYALVYSYDGFSWSPTTGTGFTGALGGGAVAFSSNGPVYSQSNFRIYEQAIFTPLVSTNSFLCMPTSMSINNLLFIDKSANAVQIKTTAPQSFYALDVNGPVRYAVIPTSVPGPTTITPQFGNAYNITVAGSYTIALSSQASSNIGKFYMFRNNSGSDITLSITGGSGIPSSLPFSMNTTIKLVVESTTNYSFF